MADVRRKVGVKTIDLEDNTSPHSTRLSLVPSVGEEIIFGSTSVQCPNVFKGNSRFAQNKFVGSEQIQLSSCMNGCGESCDQEFLNDFFTHFVIVATNSGSDCNIDFFSLSTELNHFFDGIPSNACKCTFPSGVRSTDHMVFCIMK